MAETRWDHQVDVLVVGSGAGAMTAALRAAHAGAKVLLVEKAEVYGGTSATSGGGLWIPDQHLMGGCGMHESDAQARQYMSQVGRASGRARVVKNRIKRGLHIIITKNN